MTKSIISTIGDRKLEVLFTWPQNDDLRIISVRDRLTGDIAPVSEHEKQLIYEDIFDTL